MECRHERSFQMICKLVSGSYVVEGSGVVQSDFISHEISNFGPEAWLLYALVLKNMARSFGKIFDRPVLPSKRVLNPVLMELIFSAMQAQPYLKHLKAVSLPPSVSASWLGRQLNSNLRSYIRWLGV